MLENHLGSHPPALLFEKPTDFRSARNSFSLHAHRPTSEGGSASFDGAGKGARHPDWFEGTRNSCVYEHALETPLHHLTNARRKFDTRINDQRNLWRTFTQLTSSARIAWSLASSDGSWPWHEYFAPSIHQTLTENPVFRAIRYDLEVKFYECEHGLNRTKWVWLQVNVVSDDGLVRILRPNASSRSSYSKIAAGIPDHLLGIDDPVEVLRADEGQFQGGLAQCGVVVQSIVCNHRGLVVADDGTQSRHQGPELARQIEFRVHLQSL
jgi:hypothetical protein